MDHTPEFFNVQPVADALALLFQHWTPTARTERVDPREAAGLTLAAAPRSPQNLPTFRRSTVDGYAVRAADTYGASQTLPAYARVTGRVAMGAAAQLNVGIGEATEIHTGGMLPANADAVVMVERTQKIDEREIEILAPVAPGENVVQVGEDVEEGDTILPAGRRLQAHDIGGLLAVGVTEVEVIARPLVGILSCGDELVPPDANPEPGQIRDINAHTLATLVDQAGGQPVLLGIAKDTFDDYLALAQHQFAALDVLVLTAGSSVSTRDLTRAVVNRLGAPGVLQHGLAVKPGKPTILAVCDGRPVVGLPGNPVSALLVARQIVKPVIRRWYGDPLHFPRLVSARLTANIPSSTGREDTVPVRLSRDGTTWLAEPVFGKSNLIYTLVKADGLVKVPLNSGGLKAGTLIEVELFDD